MKDDQKWKQRLSPEAYHVLREQGTERAFTGQYHNRTEEGEYHCIGCGQQLFSSTSKFDAGCGWPSFSEPLTTTRVTTQLDYSLGIVRVEVRCPRCDGHLGHLFEDGPQVTGLRYCINSTALHFEKKIGPSTNHKKK